MTPKRSINLPFVLFQVKDSLYGIVSDCVQEIVLMPKITPVPQTPPDVRGVINLRGKVIQLIDLRVRLGLPPLKAELEELAQSLREREQDHRNWLMELEACVHERRPFKMQRDPHKCKFGMWYDQYKTKDRLLQMTLPSMDAPHQAIHAIADEVLRQVESGDHNGALKLIGQHRNRELAALIKLFEDARRTLADGHRELAVVLSRGADKMAFSADAVEEVERLPDERIESMPAVLAGLGGGLCSRVGRRLKTNQTILLLDEQALFPSRRLN